MSYADEARYREAGLSVHQTLPVIPMTEFDPMRNRTAKITFLEYVKVSAISNFLKRGWHASLIQACADSFHCIPFAVCYHVSHLCAPRNPYSVRLRLSLSDSRPVGGNGWTSILGWQITPAAFAFALRPMECMRRAFRSNKRI